MKKIWFNFMLRGVKELCKTTIPFFFTALVMIGRNGIVRGRGCRAAMSPAIKIVSKARYSQMVLPLNVRIDIIESIKTIFKESIKSLNSYAVFSLVSQKIA